MAITIGVGIVVGVVLAVTALAAPPIARSVGAGVAWGWLFAAVSVGVTIATHREQMSPRLGIVDVPDLLTRADWLVGPNQMIVIAGGLAAGIAWFARRASAPRVAIALSGLAGPALIACAYVIAGPGFDDQTDQIKPYVVSLVAAGVGLLVATAIAVVRRRPDAEPTPTRADKAEQIAGTAPVSPAELARVGPVRRTGLLAPEIDRPSRTQRPSVPDPPSSPADRSGPPGEHDRDTHGLRRREKEHVDWVHNLVHGTTTEPEVKTRPERGSGR
jgi:hypothetical protein